MKLIIEENHLEKKNNILVRLMLNEDDPTFIVTRNGISFTIDEDMADSICFHLGSILQERERRKSK